MTRFKKLARIETAIENKDRPELEWALSYCKTRLSLANHKQHLKTWRKKEKEIAKALLELGIIST